jgi:hypothetical protein
METFIYIMIFILTIFTVGGTIFACLPNKSMKDFEDKITSKTDPKS